MKEINLNLNENEFKAYLLLYAAHADLKLAKEEKMKILSFVNPAHYQKIYKEFSRANDIEKLETILGHREKFFSTDKDIERLLEDICGLLQCDSKMNLQEKSFFILLRKLLKGSEPTRR